MAYARDITRDVVRYRAHKMGFGTGDLAFASDAYEEKHGEDSSHQVLLRWLQTSPPGPLPYDGGSMIMISYLLPRLLAL